MKIRHIENFSYEINLFAECDKKTYENICTEQHDEDNYFAVNDVKILSLNRVQFLITLFEINALIYLLQTFKIEKINEK